CNDDRVIPGLRELARACQQHGSKICAQVHHGGPSSPRSLTGEQPIAASAIARPEMYGYAATETPRAITKEEIAKLVDQHAQGVRRCKEAGFDCVEIAAAHKYIINSFLSRAWNKRTDEYNGDIKARARILMEILEASRALVGPDYPILVRINGCEYIDKYGVANGITIEDAKELAVLLQESGMVDAIDISSFPANNPKMQNGIYTDLAAEIKKVVSMPVITVGAITPEIGERVLQEKKADFIAIGRALFADPELVNKVKEGRMEDIRPCLSCNNCNANLFGRYNCSVNAAFGREGEYAIKPAEKSKRVLVIGGGPGGMEAATVAAQRGHKVTLAEKESRLGGLLVMASMIDERIYKLNKYMDRQVRKQGVNVLLGKEVTPQLIDEIKPDVVILAAGSATKVPDIPGINKPLVISSSAMASGKGSFIMSFGYKFMQTSLGFSAAREFIKRFGMPVGKRVVVLGGDLAGVEIAEFLSRHGKTVTVLDPGEIVMDVESPPMPKLRKHFRQQLEEKKAEILTNVKFEEIKDKGIVITTKEGQKRTIDADNIILAMGQEPKNELARKLEGKVPEIHVIGDCLQPLGIMEAIDAGAKVAREI
ncbi:MAG: FAD-dependent oxidoreductase, partial [Syntrophomonadaceae bacterium]|nr:FAD-dependent oxidoreductase [Syntrophomonadaceae bacterium]